MIELRWVEREVPCAWDIKESFVTMLKKEKVLQYRYQLPPKLVTENGSITGLESQWSDWIDVPTQEENQ